MPDWPAVFLGKIPSTPEVGQGQKEPDPREGRFEEEKVAGEEGRKEEVEGRGDLAEPT